ERSRAVHQPSPGQFAIGVKAAGVAALPQAPAGSGYLFSWGWPMISCAVKLMPQDGKELPTKKLSDWPGKKSSPALKFGSSTMAKGSLTDCGTTLPSSAAIAVLMATATWAGPVPAEEHF